MKQGKPRKEHEAFRWLEVQDIEGVQWLLREEVLSLTRENAKIRAFSAKI